MTVDDVYLQLAHAALAAWEDHAVIPRRVGTHEDRDELVGAIAAAMQHVVETAQIAILLQPDAWGSLVRNGKLVVRDRSGGPDRLVTGIDPSNAPRTLRLWL